MTRPHYDINCRFWDIVKIVWAKATSLEDVVTGIAIGWIFQCHTFDRIDSMFDIILTLVYHDTESTLEFTFTNFTDDEVYHVCEITKTKDGTIYISLVD